MDSETSDAAGIKERVTISVRLSLTSAPEQKGPVGSQVKRLPVHQANYTCLERVLTPVDSIFAGQQDGQVIMWRIPTTRTGTFNQHSVIGSHKGSVSAMCFQPFHQVLVTGSSDFTIRLWDPFGNELPQGRCVQTVPAHDATVTTLIAHCDIIVSGSADKTIKVWRFDPERAKLCFPWIEVRQVFVLDTWVTCMWASPFKVTESSQGEVFAGDSHGAVTVFRSELVVTDGMDSSRVAGLTLMRRFESEKRQSVVKILPIPNLNLVVTLSYEDNAKVRDVIAFQPLVSVPHPENKRFIDAVWDALHEELILLDAAGSVHVWSTRNNKLVLSHFAGVHACGLSFAKQQLWVAHRDAVDSAIIDRTTLFAEFKGHTDRIIAITRMAPHETELPVHWITFSADSSIGFWTKQLDCVLTLREKLSEIVSCCLLVAIPWVVTGHDDGSLKFWSIHKDTTFRFSSHDNTVSVVGEGFQRPGRKGQPENWPHLFTGSFDGCFAVWDMPSEGNKAKCEARVRVSTSEIVAAVYDPLRMAYIVGTNDGDVTVWSADELKPLMRLRGPEGPRRPAHAAAVTCVALDGNIAFTGGEDESIYMWNLVTGEFTKEFEFKSKEHLGEIQSFKVLPTSGNLLVATRSGILALFDQATGESCWHHIVHSEVSAAAYDRLGKEIVAGMVDGTLYRIVVGDLDVSGGPLGRPCPPALPKLSKNLECRRGNVFLL
jgi:WD40 repeat protein